MAQEHSPGPIPCPDLCELFRKMDANEYWTPALPPKYLVRVTRLLPGGGHRPGGGSESAGTGTGTGTSSGGGGGGGSGSGGSGGGGGGTNQRRYVANPDYDGRFDEFRDRNLTSREVRARAGAANPPPMCPGWHVKAGCNTHCGLAATHRQATAQESSDMLAWCTQWWVAPGGT